MRSGTSRSCITAFILCLACTAALIAVGLAAVPCSLAAQTGSPDSPVSGWGGQDLPLAPAASARFDRITTSDGLSDGTVLDILQDRRGFMWFATRNGLTRYDGYSFTVFRQKPGDPASLSSDLVYTVLEDRSGDLWAGTENGLNRLDWETGTFTPYLVGWPILSLFEEEDGGFWVGTTFRGLTFFDPSNPAPSYFVPGRDAKDPKGLSGNVVQTIYQDHQGEVWIGTDSGGHLSSGGLDRFDRTTETFVHFVHDPEDPLSLGGPNVRAIHEDRRGVLWIGTDGGLSRLDRSSGTFTNYRHDPDDPNSLASNLVLSILDDGDGLLWIGTDKGLDRLDLAVDVPSSGLEGTGQISRGIRFIHHRYSSADPHSLGDDCIWSLFEDRSGVVWAGTNEGLSKYDKAASQFERYQYRTDSAQSLSYGPVLAIFEDRNGVLWIGTGEGGLTRLDRPSGHVTVYQHDPQDPTSLSSNGVQAIYRDSSGALWVGTSNRWLERFDPETGTFVHEQYLSAAPASAIIEDRAGNLWIGTEFGLYRLDPARELLDYFYTSWKGPALSNDYTTRLYELQSGALLVGTAGGGLNVWVPDEEGFAHYWHEPDNPDSLSHNTVLSFHEEPKQGPVWIGTWKGLDRYDPDTNTISHYTEEDGLPGNAVIAIYADSSGYLWLGTEWGLSRFDPRTETFRNFDERDGLQPGRFFWTSHFQGASGEIFFGGSNGFTSVDPQRIPDNPHPPPIAITAVRLFNEVLREDLAPDEQIELDYRQNFLSFEFAALDFMAPERNQYAYKMQGIDEGWVFAGTRRRADYSDLGPGDYTFRVRGSNNDGVWNEEGAAVTIAIKPPFWETWWFRGSIALFFVGAVVGGYRLRVRRLEARSRELEKLVGERTDQLAALYRAEEEMHRHLDVDQVFQVVVDVAVEVLQAEKSAVLLWHEGVSAEELVVKAARGFSPEAGEQLAMVWGGNGLGRVAASGRPVVVDDVLADRRWEDERPEATRIIEAEGISSFILLPIQIGNQNLGVFNVSCAQPHAFDQEQQRLIVALVLRAALAIENAQLYGQAQYLATVEERNRLARDLHDAVTQTLFSTALIAEVLPQIWEQDPDDGRRRLDEVRQGTRSALAEMRTLLLELRPTGLDEADLGDLMRQLAESVSGRARIEVIVEIEPMGRGAQLPLEVHVALYRVAQEALNNVAKHARARCAIVRLCRDPGQVTLSISDDGRGFDPANIAADRLGIGIMRDRAKAVGARLELESEPGQGTRVTVVWRSDEAPRSKNELGDTNG
ncbi:MAG TPA: two-component regulator propeller domain-containing protein [Anaerolineae bacterium]|nr:two-component regulator propeller domain-containing protein [Anaerolineae bacterium]